MKLHSGADFGKLGRALINVQPQAYGRKLNECEEIGCGFVVSGCHTSEGSNPVGVIATVRE